MGLLNLKGLQIMKYLQNKDDYEEFYKFIVKADETVMGASRGEINSIIKLQNKNLPKAYLDFLKYMGKSNGILHGSAYTVKCFFDEEVEGHALLQYSLDLLEENNNTDLKLTDNDFVFMMHQGYIFYVIKLDEGDNPPVYYYGEDVEPPQTELLKVSESFSEFLIEIYNAYV